MTLVAFMSRWAGNHKANPLKEFSEIIESMAKIGNWTLEDKIRVAALKLKDDARASYNGKSELHDSSVTWAAFEQAYFKRFQDVCSDQYHFTQHQIAKQQKLETPQEFADRIRALTQRAIPQVEDLQAKKNCTRSRRREWRLSALRQVWPEFRGDNLNTLCRNLSMKQLVWQLPLARQRFRSAEMRYFTWKKPANA
jgi:hypothetical protein